MKTEVMRQRKILTVTLEFEMGPRKNGTARIRNAYRDAVVAASDAAKARLIDGSVETIRDSMTWEYRWLEANGESSEGVDTEEAEDDETDESE